MNTSYINTINDAIAFSIFLQNNEYENGFNYTENEKDINVKIEKRNIRFNKSFKTQKTQPQMNEGHYQKIAGWDWMKELSDKNIPENINTRAFQELTEYEWKDRLHITSAITYLETQLNEKTSIKKFYKNVLMFILTNEKDCNFNESVFEKIKKKCLPKKGGKSRRRKRKTNKKKTRKAKKKATKKKRKGNKKRKTRSRTRRRH
jgi:hypothetical protein